MGEKPTSAGKLAPNEALRPRAKDLFDLMDVLIAMRLGLCSEGKPGCPVTTLTPEAIKDLCDMASRAISATSRLIDRITADAGPGTEGPSKSGA